MTRFRGRIPAQHKSKIVGETFVPYRETGLCDSNLDRQNKYSTSRLALQVQSANPDKRLGLRSSTSVHHAATPSPSNLIRVYGHVTVNRNKFFAQKNFVNVCHYRVTIAIR